MISYVLPPSGFIITDHTFNGQQGKSETLLQVLWCWNQNSIAKTICNKIVLRWRLQLLLTPPGITTSHHDFLLSLIPALGSNSFLKQAGSAFPCWHTCQTSAIYQGNERVYVVIDKAPLWKGLCRLGDIFNKIGKISEQLWIVVIGDTSR